MKKVYVLLTLTFILIILVYGLRLYLLPQDFLNPYSKLITINPGSSILDIGKELKEKKIIKSKLFFVLMVKIKNRPIPAGEYELSPGMNLKDIIDKLTEGRFYLHRVTIPEGWTIYQIADKLDKMGLADREEFIDKAQNPNFYLDEYIYVPSEGSLEGFLFPDTYFIRRGTSSEDIIRMMLKRFEEVVPVEIEDVSKERGLTIKQLITLSSMIEREAKVKEEMPLISGVLYNRLKKGMKLQVDATVQYARGEHKSRLTYEDLKVNSPYNTYLHPGLPPGPIANPGLAAIKSALYPKTSDYLFYVAKPSGTHLFSRTYAEHLQNIKKVRGMN